MSTPNWPTTHPTRSSDADSIARLGRAVAVNLIAATQRPTQKAMGQGAVRSQMDIRICFRVRERKDVDLILGQGMLAAGWNAHTLNAPGKFLISAPEHDTPRRARAYLVTDEAVADTAAGTPTSGRRSTRYRGARSSEQRRTTEPPGDVSGRAAAVIRDRAAHRRDGRSRGRSCGPPCRSLRTTASL